MTTAADRRPAPADDTHRPLRPVAHAVTPAAPSARGLLAAPGRRLVLVFLAVTYALTALSALVAVTQHADVTDPFGGTGLGAVALFAQAFWPLAGALVARRLAGLPLRRGWGLRRPSARVVAAAWAFGLAVPLASAVPLLAAGTLTLDVGKLAASVGAGSLPTVLGGLLGLAMGTTVGVLPYVLLAIGEELGWRSVLVPWLAATGSVRRLVLLSGLAWSVFHWPLMALLGGTPPGVPVPVAILCFTVTVTAAGAIFAWMRLRWGLWSVMVAHAAYNSALYVLLQPATVAHPGANWWADETGIALALTMTAAAVLWLRRAPLVVRDGVVVAATCRD